MPRFPHDQSSDLEHLPDRARTPMPRWCSVSVPRGVGRNSRAARRQRQALLLNLKDDALSCSDHRDGILRALAETLEMDVAALAGLWNELPLSDNNIALRLGCTRQQVINLRMAARKRLVNRLDGRANMAPVRTSLWTMNATT